MVALTVVNKVFLQYQCNDNNARTRCTNYQTIDAGFSRVTVAGRAQKKRGKFFSQNMTPTAIPTTRRDDDHNEAVLTGSLSTADNAMSVGRVVVNDIQPFLAALLFYYIESFFIHQKINRRV
jgi:hypothetical protein